LAPAVWPLPFAGQAFQPDGLTSEAGQSLTGVVTALLSAAIPARREMAEESRFLVFPLRQGYFLNPFWHMTLWPDSGAARDQSPILSPKP